MAAAINSVDIHDHGVALAEKHRAQCNYCGKVVSSFFRLKFHLGGIRGDVKPCDMVPENVKELFRNMLLQLKEPAELHHSDHPRKRKVCSSSNRTRRDKCEAAQIAFHDSGSNAEIESEVEGVMQPVSRPISVEHSSSSQGLKGTRRFHKMYSNFSVANFPRFKTMMNSSICRSQANFELERPTFQEVRQVQEHAKRIRDSWASTGCSILLDGWVDQNGRNLVNFIVHCPKGQIYLQTSDLSTAIANIEALQSLLDRVIEEVGVSNVVQVIASSTTGWMGHVGKKFMERRTEVFWTVSASHCIELMLEEMSKLDTVRGVLDKAQTITSFINDHAQVLKLFRDHAYDFELVKPHKIILVMTFLTLENLIFEMNNLKAMFESQEWYALNLASTKEGNGVVDLVNDVSFWTGANVVMKAAIPLVNILLLLIGADEPHVGYLYESMDKVKEAIQEELNEQKLAYKPIWDLIDNNWNTHLHSPLHASGYYLNPNLFYTSDFHCDAEVTSGLLSCTVRMVQDQPTQHLISLQLMKYLHAEGDFSEGYDAAKLNKYPPDEWWSYYGNHCPELQRFAIQVLSQTCDGAFKYGLSRSLSEQLFTDNGMTPMEQQQLMTQTWVQHNLQLQKHSSR